MKTLLKIKYKTSLLLVIELANGHGVMARVVATSVEVVVVEWYHVGVVEDVAVEAGQLLGLQETYI